MSTSETEDLLPLTPDPLSDHCRVLGLPIWRLDAGGAVIAQPFGWGPAETWLRSKPLVDRIRKAVSGWSDERQSRAAELFAGCWLLPIARTEHPAGRWVTAAMALGKEMLRSPEFLEVCRAAELDEDRARDAVSCLARYRRPDLLQLAATLRWMHDEMVSSADHANALGVFSRELAHAYEQISMLYKLGRSMNWLTRPEEFVSITCNLLLEMFDFRWIALRYASGKPAPPTLAGDLVVAGELPCPEPQLDTLLEALLGGITEDHWRTLLEPDGHELAAHVGTQVVAEPVMSGGRVAALLVAGGKTGPDSDVTSVETQMLDATAEYLGAFLHNVALYAE